MVLVDSAVFQDMFDKGVLIGNKKHSKDWTITSCKKGNKRKKHYVGDGSWSKYCNILRSNSK